MYWKIYTYNSISEVSPVDSPPTPSGVPLLSTLWGTSVYRRQMKTVPQLRTCTVHHGWFPISMEWSNLNVDMSKTLATNSTFSHESTLICTDPVYSKCNIPWRKLIEKQWKTCFPLNKCHQNVRISNRLQFDSMPDSDDFWCHSMQHIPYCFTPPIRSGGLFFIGISYPTMVLTLPTAGVRKRKAPSELWVRSVQSNDSTGKVSSKKCCPQCESKFG